VLDRLKPTMPTVLRIKPSRWPIAIAAAVLAMVSFGSYAFFLPPAQLRPTPSDVAAIPTPTITVPTVPVPTVPVEPEYLPEATAKSNGPEVDDAIAKLGPEPELVDVIAKPTVEPEKSGDIFGSPHRIETRPLKSVDIAIPVLLQASEFHTEVGAARLKEELSRDSAVRIDLFGKNGPVVLEQLQAAAKAANIHLFTDALTAERIKKPLGFAFALYVENLSADELAGLLTESSRLVSALPQPEGILGKAHLIPAGTPEQKDVKDLVGVEFLSGRALKSSASEPKPISSDTLGKVTQALKKSEKAAIVLTYLPTNQRLGAAKSAEVKAFLDKRGERLKGTVPALIVVR